MACCTWSLLVQTQDTNLSMKYERLFSYIVRTHTCMYEEYLYVQYDTYLCTKKRFGHIFVTLRAAQLGHVFVTLRAEQLGELYQGRSSIRTFVRPNKHNDGRRSQS